MSFVIAITGPSGSGKSTVAEKLAKQMGHCVNIDADHIKHMIVSGFSYEIKPDGTKKYDFDQWELVGESIGLLARNFSDKGYDVIINGYIDEPAWDSIQKHVSLTHKVVLLPHIGEAIKRDSLRQGDLAMGEEMVTEHHNHFSSAEHYKDFMKLDSSHQTIDETIEAIKEVLGKAA